MNTAKRMTGEELSWILYDVANSAFVLVMVTAIMPIYFKEVAAIGLDSAVSTANWGFANSAAALILALLSPVLGTFADYPACKKRFFLSFLAAGLFFTVMLTLVGPGQWFICLLLFVLARVGWAGANLFYDAFLVDVASRDRMDLISARGYAFGYIGSVIPFLLVIILILTADGGGDSLPAGRAKIGFLVIALWWFLFSLPMARSVKQVYAIAPSPTPIRDSFLRLAETFRNISRYRDAFIFLIAYFFYIDGVGTIITMSTAYGRDLGFGVTTLIGVLLFIQIVAFPFALLYGMLAGRFGTKAMLLAGIAVYCCATLFAFLLPAIGDLRLKTLTFWFIALLVASSMGGIQALSRSYFGRLIPARKSAEFFGFYNVFGKFAAITGPLLMGVVGRLSGETRWGVLSILILFVAGGFVLLRVGTPPDDSRGRIEPGDAETRAVSSGSGRT